MRILDTGVLPVTILTTLAGLVVLIAVRVFIIRRLQRRWQLENRQAADRVRALVGAYRALAGSFTPPRERDDRQVEEALADIVLFGSLAQVQLAVDCFHAMVDRRGGAYQPLVEALRADLRAQLGLEAIPAELAIPPSGPGRAPRLGEGGGMR